MEVGRQSSSLRVSEPLQESVQISEIDTARVLGVNYDDEFLRDALLS
jgi:hypothetical protein